MKQRVIDFLLAAVWLVMGLYCKLLGQVPRHEAIVGSILGDSIATWLTPMIGAGEVLLGIAIATGLYRKLLASIQIPFGHHDEHYRVQLRCRQPSLGTAKHNLCPRILLCRLLEWLYSQQAR
jgi:hypothetical protein